jgi:hypothetical protein
MCLAECEKLEIQAASQEAPNREVDRLRQEIRTLEGLLGSQKAALDAAKLAEANAAGCLNQIEAALFGRKKVLDSCLQMVVG